MTTEQTLDLRVDAIHSRVYRTSCRDLQQLIGIVIGSLLRSLPSRVSFGCYKANIEC